MTTLKLRISAHQKTLKETLKRQAANWKTVCASYITCIMQNFILCIHIFWIYVCVYIYIYTHIYFFWILSNFNFKELFSIEV